MGKDFYTTHEVGKLCAVYPTTVIKWIKEGALAAHTTPGGHRRIKRADLLKLMKKNKMPIPVRLEKGNQKRILVIDDDLKILKMIKTILSVEDNLEVSIVNSGFEAGLIISKWLPDMILLDFRMPEMDGFAVTRRLKSDAKTKDIPIIAVTVLREPEEVKKMFAAGITDYLPKPFKSAELVEKIKKHLFIE